MTAVFLLFRVFSLYQGIPPPLFLQESETEVCGAWVKPVLPEPCVWTWWPEFQRHQSQISMNCPPFFLCLVSRSLPVPRERECLCCLVLGTHPGPHAAGRVLLPLSSTFLFSFDFKRFMYKIAENTNEIETVTFLHHMIPASQKSYYFLVVP